jgi:hypothetical protein
MRVDRCGIRLYVDEAERLFGDGKMVNALIGRSSLPHS